MARTIDTDGQLYRVVVERKRSVPNPKYAGQAYNQVTGQFVELSPGEERFILSNSETYTEKYGPYATLGAAKGQLARHTSGGEWHTATLVRAYIEGGRVPWEEVVE